jgi:hypothetical protein
LCNYKLRVLNVAPSGCKYVISFWDTLWGIVAHLCYARGGECKGVEIINSRSWDVSQMCVMCIPSLRDSRQLINQNNARGNALVCKEKRHLKNSLEMGVRNVGSLNLQLAIRNVRSLNLHLAIRNFGNLKLHLTNVLLGVGQCLFLHMRDMGNKHLIVKCHINNIKMLTDHK